MSNIDPEKDYSDLTEVLTFAFEQMLKGLSTALPAIVDSYDDVTRRAKVIPAIRLRDTEGQLIDRKPLVNIPVVFMSGGGYTAKVKLTRGDGVLLIFSQRGLDEFKKSFVTSNPDSGFFDLKDAMALPGFGPLSITPAPTDGISLQANDASTYLTVDGSGVHVLGDMDVTGDLGLTGNLNVTGTATFGGIEFGPHQHAIVWTDPAGSGLSGPALPGE